MSRFYKTITVAIAVSLLAACGSSPHIDLVNTSVQSNFPVVAKEQVKDLSINDHVLSVATWNVEHLAYPIDQGCKPRNEDELQEMRAYAQKLDVDIVALQEVASKEAVHLLLITYSP